MDLDKIKEQIALLRQRRVSLAELRDYRPQARKAKELKTAVTPMDDKPIEETFASLFASEETNDTARA